MAKRNTHYVCQSCGAANPKWVGQCPACGAWNSLVEEQVAVAASGRTQAGYKTTGSKAKIELTDLSTPQPQPPRILSGTGEFDRVCGGGLVAGSVTLIGGDPGIGKSTLLLQIMGQISKHHPCAYMSGEEGLDQIRLRAERLGLLQAPVQLAATNLVDDIISTFTPHKGQAAPIKVLVIDSIQTMFSAALDSAPGTVAQVRTCAANLIHLAKTHNIAVLLVGHVTKEGTIAGPRVLEHMVDTVLYFEGERGMAYRILRAVKNRFGPTDEIGVFDMRDNGLQEVTNPSALFLTQRTQAVSGSVVLAGMEGTRPMLVEIQALVSAPAYGTPRRAVLGWDSNRLAMIVAVLETRCGVALGGRDIYLNVAGGLKISEPAADVAVAAALLSAFFDVPAPLDAVYFGEIALSGEVRPVQHMTHRLKESLKLGFNSAITPLLPKGEKPQLDVQQLKHLRALVGSFSKEAGGGE